MTTQLHIPLETAGWAPVDGWSRLDEVGEVFDCPHTTPALVEDGPFLARSQDVRGRVFDWRNAGRVSARTYRERIARAEPRFGDLLYSREGTYFGMAAEVPQGMKVCLGQRMVLIRPNEERLNHRFLLYWLNSPVMQRHLEGFRDGSVAERLNLTTIRALPIPLPSLTGQRDISATLGSLDDKIESNRKTVALLEEMARALYRSWFVNFDPVRARSEGRAPAHMDSATAALFPDSFNESALPTGWRISEVGQELDILDSKRVPLSKPQRAARPGPIPYYGATSVMDFVDKALFDEELLLVGEDGSVVRHDGTPFTQYIWGPSWVNNHAHCLKGHRFSVPQLKCIFDQVQISAFVNGAVQAKLNQTNLRKVPFTEASTAIHAAFDSNVIFWFERIRSLLDENRTLASLRDMLLPRLMSGELRIDAKRESTGRVL